MERASRTAVGTTKASGNLARGPRSPRRAETWANGAPRNRGNDAKGLSVQDLPVVLRCQWVPTRGLNRLLGRGDGDVEALNPKWGTELTYSAQSHSPHHSQGTAGVVTA